VTTTRRLLGYCRTIRELTMSTVAEGDRLRIEVGVGNGWIKRPPHAADLDGLSFYVTDPFRTRVTLSGREVPDLRRNGPDHTGRPSVSIPWPRLEFPAL
jgi:hypothetical protein